jgi:hypothetical protein
VGPPDSPVVHWTVTVHCSMSGAPSGACSDSARVVRALFMHCSLLQTTVGAISRCSAWHTGQSGATPDSLVNYSGVAPQILEASKLELIHPGALDTVLWCTGQSGAPEEGSLRMVLLLSI